MSIAESIAQRVQSMVRDAGGDAPAADADSASEADGSPPTVDSGAESASADVSTSGASSVSPSDTDSASPEATNAASLQHQLLEEKLEITREQRRIAREHEAAAKRAREEAEADRKAAAEERAKLEARKKKPWLERIKEDGDDPATVWEQMRQEALTAGTPEAKIAALQAAHAAEMASIRDEFKTFRESLEAEKTTAAERAREAAAHAEQAAFDNHFEVAIGLPQFASLVDEYDPGPLYRIVDNMKRNPDVLFAQAKELRVNLTAPPGQFNMGDIFSVLKATQDAHRARQAAKARPLEQSTQASVEAKTVNGTTDRRNAGSALGNNTATERATDTKPRTTRRERIRRLAGG